MKVLFTGGGTAGHINPALAAQARVVLDINKAERHIRGGMATRRKYRGD